MYRGWLQRSLTERSFCCSHRWNNHLNPDIERKTYSKFGTFEDSEDEKRSIILEHVKSEQFGQRLQRSLTEKPWPAFFLLPPVEQIIWIQKGKPTQSPAPLWIPRWYQQSTREEKKPMVRRTIWQRLQRSLKKPWLTLLLPQSFGNKPTQSLGTFVDSEDDMLRTRSWEL